VGGPRVCGHHGGGAPTPRDLSRPDGETPPSVRKVHGGEPLWASRWGRGSAEIRPFFNDGVPLTKAASLGLAALLVASTALLAFGPAGAAYIAAGWSPPVIVSDREVEGAISAGPSVALDGEGNALAAWSGVLPAFGYSTVFHRSYTPEGGWGPTSILQNGWGPTNQPEVAAASNGNFMIVYRSDAGGALWVDAALYDASTGTWSYSSNVNADGPAVDISQPQVAFDGAGNAFAIWVDYNGTTFDLKASRYVVGSGWGTPSFLETSAYGVLAPKLAVDGAGNAVAIWRQSTGTTNHLYANRFVVGSGWGTAQMIDSLPDEVYNPAIAVDTSGNLEALWTQSNGTYNDLYASRFVPGTGWGTPFKVTGDDNRGVGVPRVAAGPSGEFVAAWNQYNGVEYQMMVSRYDAAGWATPVNLSASFTVGGGQAGHVAVDGSGRAVVVWEEYMGAAPTQVLVSWWTEGQGWTTPARADNHKGPGSPRLGDFALNAASQGVALWAFNDGYFDNLWASVYSRLDTTAPSLAIAGPADGSASDNATVLVYGTAEQGAEVWVAGARVATTPVASLAAWSALVPLMPGENLIGVRALDGAGNVATASVKVTYNDPVPGLEADLAASRAALATTQSQLATTQASLASTQGQLAAAQSDLAATRTALNTTQVATTAKDAELLTKVDSAAGSVGTAMLLGLLGLLAGAAAIAMGFMMPKKGPSSAGAPASAPPAAPPPPPPEPPKTG